MAACGTTVFQSVLPLKPPPSTEIYSTLVSTLLCSKRERAIVEPLPVSKPMSYLFVGVKFLLDKLEYRFGKSKEARRWRWCCVVVATTSKPSHSLNISLCPYSSNA